VFYGEDKRQWVWVYLRIEVKPCKLGWSVGRWESSTLHRSAFLSSDHVHFQESESVTVEIYCVFKLKLQ
jgi:hypothetical protein